MDEIDRKSKRPSVSGYRSTKVAGCRSTRDKQVPVLVQTKVMATTRKEGFSITGDGDTNEEEKRDESRALSPAIRLSLSGIAPPDLNENDDEQDDDEDVILMGHYFKNWTIFSRMRRGTMPDGHR
ncbi:uncharacterized protein LOC110679268 isoform X2 [Aedes aegypti]|uniref:Uncharacterized protein n=1 Tax=Aedes aegypti TaxID=7159 RepID=A0A6I8U5S2_AEDAE|nr:uncharacterized protein LOC110679268 isoform X2 [Aedes aegypti]